MWYRVLVVIAAWSHFAFAIDPIERRVPPRGIEIPEQVARATESELVRLYRSFSSVRDHPAAADVQVLLKAVELAVRQQECYQESDLSQLGATLELAEQRIESLREGSTPWATRPVTVRGFYSRIDNSPQPYGLVLPDTLSPTQSMPLYVWLHGRGDKTTDIHFIHQRLAKRGQISPPDAIVLHPFGRQCIGFKSAGETDVLEAIAHVQANYSIDADRIVLMGFSMGGAGAWHLGAHYADRFAAIAPGAGFVETARYNRLTAKQINNTPSYERQLWGLYDVPNYVRNLFNVPVVAYSGEHDKQIQAARVMEEAFLWHAKKLRHVIGPGMGHKYQPDALREILDVMRRAVHKGRQSSPRIVRLQTRTLRYPSMHWLTVERLHQHWRETSVTAEVLNDWIRISTSHGRSERERQPLSNVVQLAIDPLPTGIQSVVIDGTKIPVPPNSSRLVLSREDRPTLPTRQGGPWRRGPVSSKHLLSKQPGLQGPIDDVFLEPFVVVTPSETSGDPKFDAWVEFELDHLRDRWSALFRAKLPERVDTAVTADDVRKYHLVVFGSPRSNQLLRQTIMGLPLEWERGRVSLGTKDYEGPHVVPLLIHPNPLNQGNYLVVNSGPTFREAHDRTNSLQNPKLPDWAILDISTPPNAEYAGAVVDAGFFDEHWQPSTRR